MYNEMLTNKSIGKCALLAGIIVGGVMLYGNSAKGYESIEDATYQGWRKDEGQQILVFDPEPLSQRQGNPEHRILGNLDKLDLELGESYDLTVKIPRIGPKKVVDATPNEE